jgi:hypothetical protein
LQLPKPERPSLEDFDRWSSNSSVSSEPSVPLRAPTKPKRRRPSNGSSQEESKQQVDGDDEESVLSLISGILTNYAAAKVEHDMRCRGVSLAASRLPKPCLKKTVVPVKRTYTVDFDRIMIREYELTVGDNPACTCGPPITLDWNFVSSEVYTVEDYESLKPIKRTKKQFYLPARMRATILIEDWQVAECELKKARREVTYIQYCRERAIIGTSREGLRRRRGSMNVMMDSPKGPDGADMSGCILGVEQQHDPVTPSQRRARSLSPPRGPSTSTACQEEPMIPVEDEKQHVVALAVPSEQNAEQFVALTPPPPPPPLQSPTPPPKKKLRKQNSCSSLSSLDKLLPPKKPNTSPLMVRMKSDIFVPRRMEI